MEFQLNGRKYRLISAQLSTADAEKDLSHLYAGELIIGTQRYHVLEAPRQAATLSDGAVRSLTKREIQIVVLVAEGLPNKQIAYKLNISEWTVSTHLRRIFAKLGVDSRAAMIYRSIEFLPSHI
ncbi:MAG: LuxR C-terminal-related transcriptional regulator [Desulforhopalus sp.]|nr:LuxR C-terminal-related transcriptional regulator [Desulforhopalus sp.]